MKPLFYFDVSTNTNKHKKDVKGISKKASKLDSKNKATPAEKRYADTE